MMESINYLTENNLKNMTIDWNFITFFISCVEMDTGNKKSTVLYNLFILIIIINYYKFPKVWFNYFTFYMNQESCLLGQTSFVCNGQ